MRVDVERAVAHQSTGSRVLLIAVIGVAYALLFPPEYIGVKYDTLELSAGLLIAVLLIAAWRPTPMPRPVMPTVFIALIVWMLCSTAWSFDRWYTLRDASSYLLLAAAAFVIAQTARLSTILAGVVTGGLIVAIASALLVWVAPDHAIDSWNLVDGIYDNRNALGFVMVQTLPAAIALPLPHRWSLVLRPLLIAVFVGGVWLSGSVTALLTAIAVLAAWLVLSLVMRHRIFGYITLIVAVGGGVVVWNYTTQILRLLGKSETLSGRTAIWEAVWQVIQTNPILGQGWTSSWPVDSPQNLAASFPSRLIFHAHNELLNWLVTTGVVGGVLVLAVHVFGVAAGLKIYRLRQIAGAIWMPLAMVMILVRGIAEISETAAQGWFVLALVLCICARTLNPNGPAALLVELPVWRASSIPAAGDFSRRSRRSPSRSLRATSQHQVLAGHQE